MASVNKVILIGNLTRDPELKHTPRGSAVCELGLAINRKYKVDGQTKEDVTFVDVTFWGPPAETISKWMSRGKPLYVEGRLQMDTWEDKSTGNKRSKLKVTGEQFQFLGDGGGGSSARSSPPPATRTNPTPSRPHVEEGEENLF